MSGFSFNVLDEPWIPVETSDGEFKPLGLRDVIYDAHKLRGILGYSPLLSYGMHRILIAFLIDAFLPSEEKDIRNLVKKGSFDKNTVEDYIKKCNSNGERFDLFNVNKPFLQTAFKDEEKIKPDYITKLFEDIPSGNSHIHFNHTLEDTHFFSPAECIQALCSQGAYAINFGRSAHFGINKHPPIYFLYSGENLFQTLTLSMVNVSDYSDFPDTPLVAWREETDVKEDVEMRTISLLHGLVSMPRRIQFIPENLNDKVIIKRMWYSKGYNYKNLANWKDPHVVYFYDSKKELKILRARESRAVWRDLGTILSENAQLNPLKNIREKLQYR